LPAAGAGTPEHPSCPISSSSKSNPRKKSPAPMDKKGAAHAGGLFFNPGKGRNGE
jgi:hypothetical protein